MQVLTIKKMIEYQEGSVVSKEIIKKETDLIEIRITDNGIGRKKSKELKTKNQKTQNSRGMGNIKKRVAILNTMYKDQVSVSVKDLNEDASGTQVILTLRKVV